MEKKEENFFDFLPGNSVIKYKKFNFDLKKMKSSDFNLKKGNYTYDIYSDKFIYCVADIIYIFNRKGELEKNVKYSKNQKIRHCTCDKYINYMLIISENNKVFILNIKNGNISDYNTIDLKSGSVLGYIYGGFFIPKIGKDDKKKEQNEFNIGLISKNSYRIVNITINGREFQYKNVYISERIPITEYYFNNIFNVLIIRNEYQGFFLINLKNSYCFNSCIELIINNVYLISKFYIQNIYKKLYFIHFTENIIEFYRLNNIKKIKEPKRIVFNKSEKPIDYELTQIQFYNNLIILYMDDNIRIYDIKAGQTKKFGKYDIPKNKVDGFLDKLKIYGKFVVINNDIYKIKFLPDNYLTKNITNTFETFFNLLRRKNSTSAVLNLLIDLLKNYEISAFYAILFRLIENCAKSKEEKNNDDKKNIFQIIYIGHNFFYLPPDDIFSLFSNDFNNIENVKLLQIMVTVYNEYIRKNIAIDKDVFISALFYQLNKTEDFSFLDFMIKNKVIPVNKNLGLYLIDRAKTIKNKENKKLALNLGIEILLSENENIDDVLFELIQEEKYEESINIITDYYFGYSYKTDKKNKDIKGDINKHLRKFITGKLNNINKLRGQSCVIEEEGIEF